VYRVFGWVNFAAVCLRLAPSRPLDRTRIRIDRDPVLSSLLAKLLVHRSVGQSANLAGYMAGATKFGPQDMSYIDRGVVGGPPSGHKGADAAIEETALTRGT